MKTVAGLLMVANAGLFLFGAVQHAGVAVGSFHEPVIIPAAIVETLSGLCLLWGATALFRGSRARWRVQSSRKGKYRSAQADADRHGPSGSSQRSSAESPGDRQRSPQRM